MEIAGWILMPKLGQLERDKDAVFVALCEIARQWVYPRIDASICTGGE